MPQIDSNLYERRHLILGKVSFVISLVGMILFIVGIILSLARIYFGIILIFPGSILTNLGLIFGAITYFGPYKDNYGLVGFILALITTCILPIMMAITSYSSFYYMMM